MIVDVMIFLLLYIVIGFYVTTWMFGHAQRWAMGVGEVLTIEPSEVIAVYLLWPIAVPLSLAIMHMPNWMVAWFHR